MSFELGSFPLDEIVTGRIVKLEPRGVLVDFGIEQLAYIPQSELLLVKVQFPEEAAQLNQVREFLVVGNYEWQHNCFFPDCTPETLNSSDRLYEVAQYRASLGREYQLNREDLLIHTEILAVQPDGVHARIQWFVCSERPPTVTFSIRGLELRTAWERIRQLQAENVTLYPKLVEKTRHSAIVEVEGIKGFINNIDRCRDQLVVGEELPLKILTARERFAPNLISCCLSLIRSCTLAKLRQLQIGQSIIGTARAVKAYGVFVDIEGVSAFLHRSKIIPSVDHPGQIFNVNDSVKAIISDIGLERAWVELESCERLA
jgi:ribosomal protein S1